MGWNAGRNLAVSANFLDGFSIGIIRRDIMRGDVAPWPCACGDKPVEAPARGKVMGLPLHRYAEDRVTDVGSAIMEWIHDVIPFIHRNRDFLYKDPCRFARVWRYLHELDLDGVESGDDAMPE